MATREELEAAVTAALNDFNATIASLQVEESDDTLWTDEQRAQLNASRAALLVANQVLSEFE